jgi:murein endopeptidase
VLNLQLALAKFRHHSGYAGPLIVSDMSTYRGRAFGSHDSHQSGRDVDVWLPLRMQPDGATVRGVRIEADEEPDFRLLSAQRASDVDWPATWELVKALIRTGEVQYIFLSRSRQRHLYRAAKADGHDARALGEVLQYPRRAQTAIVRHAPDHTRHLHVRFRCADHERRCR